MPDPDKWITEYRSQCQKLCEQDPAKKKSIKKHLRHLEDLWELLPLSHKKTVMRIKTGIQ